VLFYVNFIYLMLGIWKNLMFGLAWFMVFNATFNNISAIMWRSNVWICYINLYKQ